MNKQRGLNMDPVTISIIAALAGLVTKAAVTATVATAGQKLVNEIKKSVK